MEYILTLVLTAVAAAIVIVIQSALSKKDSPFYGLIVPCVLFCANLITFLVMLAKKATVKNIILVFAGIYLTVAIGVISFVIFRLRYAKTVSADNRRRNKMLAARRAEAENQKKLLERLKGFICPESTLDPQAQREIVIMAKLGKTSEEISEETSVPASDIDIILASFKRYAMRIDSDEGSTDIILSPSQQEEIVSNIVNSLPGDHDISPEGYWTKSSVRTLASTVIGTGVSSRIVSAYLRHWGLSVPTAMTIKARRENPMVANWLVGEFEEIREKCREEGGEIIWIYTLKPEALYDVSKNLPTDVTLLMALTNDGYSRFKVFPSNENAIFEKFTKALIADAPCKYFAVVNENFDSYMSELGRVSLRAFSDRIEFFKAK